MRLERIVSSMRATLVVEAESESFEEGFFQPHRRQVPKRRTTPPRAVPAASVLNVTLRRTSSISIELSCTEKLCLWYQVHLKFVESIL